MHRASTSAPPPTLLPLGTVVGPWRVVAWAGQGVHGAVYRAVRVGQEQAPPVAIKIALLPQDPRFAREVALLSRTDHPSIPLLIDTGEWLHPGGTRHPYLAMEWIDGVPLYDWAREHPPDSQQVLRLLAQLASALQALHAQQALHRDVKGDNVLVRRSDDRAILTDLGSGFYSGAATLTPQTLPPGTPAYRAPEAWLFELLFGRHLTARYRSGPADDLYALGVTACRLVTGEYPELGEPFKDEAGSWQLDAVVPPAALLLDSRMDPLLRALILRMLSVRPEERGTAAELAEALERAAEHTSTRSTQTLIGGASLSPSPRPREEPAAKYGHAHDALAPVCAPASQDIAVSAEPEGQAREAPAGARGFATLVRPQGHRHSWQPWVLIAAAGLALAIGWWSVSNQPEEEPAARAEAVGSGKPDAGTVGLGDSAAITSPEDSAAPLAPEGMAEDTLPEPRPGQTRPDAKGRCPRRGQVALNRGCWAATAWDREGCAELGGQMFKGTCYVPFIPPGRRPTSSPMDKP